MKRNAAELFLSLWQHSKDSFEYLSKQITFESFLMNLLIFFFISFNYNTYNSFRFYWVSLLHWKAKFFLSILLTLIEWTATIFDQSENNISCSGNININYRNININGINYRGKGENTINIYFSIYYPIYCWNSPARSFSVYLFDRTETIDLYFPV